MNNKQKFYRFKFSKAIKWAWDEQLHQHDLDEKDKAHYFQVDKNGYATKGETYLWTFTLLLKYWTEINKPEYLDRPERVWQLLITKYRDSIPEEILENLDEMEDEFLLDWENAATSDLSPEEKAVLLADERPLKIEKGSSLYRRFLSFVGWLCVERNSRFVVLSQTRIAELLDCGQDTVSRWITQAKKEGYLRVSEKHHFNTGKSRKNRATEYSVFTKKWPEIDEKIINEWDDVTEDEAETDDFDELDAMFDENGKPRNPL